MAHPRCRIKLIATNNSATQLSDFSLTFTDADGDLLVSLDEITSFSGVSGAGFDGAFLDRVSGISDGGFVVNQDVPVWGFERTSDRGQGFAGVSVWTYQISPLAPVPLPGALGLFGLGIFGVSNLRRRLTGA